MLTIFKKLFGRTDNKKNKAAAPVDAPLSAAPPPFESAIQLNKVEVAKLSLAAIVARFPEDLRALVTKLPDASATVALPIQTMVKQLPGGVVRMSLASLHRQSPAGTFKPLAPGDKRMVEVPLAEVLKHIKPQTFKRRADQRPTDLPPEDLSVFNSRNAPAKPTPNPAKPEAIKQPTEIKEVAEKTNKIEKTEAAPAPTAMRVVAPPVGFEPSPARQESKAPIPTKASATIEPKGKPDVAEPTAPFAASLVLPLKTICEKWPEAVLSEIANCATETTVSLPVSEVSAGMARGKINFTWGQIRAWFTPTAQGSSEVDPATEILLPLKVVAPAFLAQTKRPTTGRKSAVVDESIPALFNARKSEAEAAPAEASAQQNPTLTVAPATNEKLTIAQGKPEEFQSDTSVVIVTEPATEPATSIANVAPAPDTTPAPDSTTTVAIDEGPKQDEAPAETAPLTVGAIFGEADRESWTPAELVARCAKLSGVAGAVVGLQEGFQVAHSLPEGVNAETVSAFLPQIFGRLNQYAGEMKLGDVDDLLFTTRGAHCLVYRLGTVYFAVLGKPGASLPWNELRIIAAELSRQVQK